MNKKLLALVGAVALGIGGVSAVALQSHAQNASVVTTPAVQGNATTDTDNIQNDKGGIETPDAAVSQAPDKETNDDQSVTSTVKQVSAQEHAEGSAADINEVEDGN
jgi:uncharacterized protein HemX